MVTYAGTDGNRSRTNISTLTYMCSKQLVSQLLRASEFSMIMLLAEVDLFCPVCFFQPLLFSSVKALSLTYKMCCTVFFFSFLFCVSWLQVRFERQPPRGLVTMSRLFPNTFHARSASCATLGSILSWWTLGARRKFQPRTNLGRWRCAVPLNPETLTQSVY